MSPDATAYEPDHRATGAVDFDFEAVDRALADYREEGNISPEALHSLIKLAVLRERKEQTAWILRVLFAGKPDLEQIARRACTLGYVLQFEEAPAKSVRGLAEHFNVSVTRAQQLCTALEQIILENPRV